MKQSLQPAPSRSRLGNAVPSRDREGAGCLRWKGHFVTSFKRIRGMTASLIFTLGSMACALSCGASRLVAQSPAALGVFDDNSDVGVVARAGSVKYDASTHAYTVSGSGENM